MADRFHLVENFLGAIQGQLLHRQYASQWAVLPVLPVGEAQLEDSDGLTSKATDVECHRETVQLVERASMPKDANEVISLFKADTPTQDFLSPWLTYGMVPERNA